MTARSYESKTKLTPEQEITAAYSHVILGVSMQHIAAMMGGVNQARVYDAVSKVRKAVGLAAPLQEETA